MRNWHYPHHPQHPQHPQQSRRTLPMRNWHICTSINGTQNSNIMSDITYEELTQDHCKKKLFIVTVGHYLWGVDTFFKISLAFVILNILLLNVGHYLWGIDTSWIAILSCSMSCWCRTLPMRNWHTFSGLIGSAFVCRLLPASRTLPMRNWHKASVNLSRITSSDDGLSDITYEELTRKDWRSPYLLRWKHQVRRTLPMRNWHKYFSCCVIHR